MCEIVPVPGLDSQLVLGESREIYILMAVHDIGTFMTIEICTFWYFSPHKVEFQHPLASGFEGNQFEDMVMLQYLRLLYEIDDCLGRKMPPDISDVSLQLLNKLGIIEEGITTGVRVAVIWKHRMVTTEVLGPCLKLLTACGTPPKYGSSIISSLGPSFTSSVDCEEPIEIIQPSSEYIV